MTIEEIRAYCGNKRMGDIESHIRASMLRIDETFLSHVFKYYLNHSSEISPAGCLDRAMESEDVLAGAIEESRGETWYNTYPFGVAIDKVYSRFLGICRGKNKLNDVLKHAVKHNVNVAKYCEPSQYRDRTTVILTNFWDDDVFKKYEKEFLRHAMLWDIWTVFILVTDYGFEQIPFLPNDRDALAGLVLDGDEVRADVQKWMNEPVQYSIKGGPWNKDLHNEYTIYLYDKVWELYSFEEGLSGGKISYEAVNKFMDEVLWIAEADEKELKTDKRSFDGIRYELRIFGKKLFWDSAAIDKNGDPRYIKLDKALKKLIKAFEPNVERW